MYYSDIINVPYKAHGRDLNGLDCYGAVIMCCERAGTPLRDVYYKRDSVPASETEHYIAQGLNVRKIDREQVGAVCEMEYSGHLHVGYIVARGLVLHATRHGVKVSPVQAVHIKNYYEVVNED